MHRLILPNVPEVDHADRNKLNNRRSNLRPSNRSMNTQNTEGRGFVPYRGVFRDRIRGGALNSRYRITYMDNGVQVFPRERYDTAEAAARAYNEHAVRVYGPTAFQNEV